MMNEKLDKKKLLDAMEKTAKNTQKDGIVAPIYLEILSWIHKIKKGDFNAEK